MCAYAYIKQEEFSLRKNNLYKKLFGIDLLDVCRHPTTLAKRMTSPFRAWVDIRILEDVQSSDVLKFQWKISDVIGIKPKNCAQPPGILAQTPE